MRRALTIILLAALFIGAVALVYQERHPLRLLWIDQSSLCLFTQDQQAADCRDGQLAYYKPESARGGQAMLNVAAAYCDVRYQILRNEGGVLCVFTDERRHLMTN